MKKLVSVVVAASVLGLASAAFAGTVPMTNNGQPVKHCSDIKDKKARAACKKEHKKDKANGVTTH